MMSNFCDFCVIWIYVWVRSPISCYSFSPVTGVWTEFYRVYLLSYCMMKWMVFVSDSHTEAWWGGWVGRVRTVRCSAARLLRTSQFVPRWQLTLRHRPSANPLFRRRCFQNICRDFWTCREMLPDEIQLRFVLLCLHLLLCDSPFRNHSFSFKFLFNFEFFKFICRFDLCISSTVCNCANVMLLLNQCGILNSECTCTLHRGRYKSVTFSFVSFQYLILLRE